MVVCYFRGGRVLNVLFIYFLFCLGGLFLFSLVSFFAAIAFCVGFYGCFSVLVLVLFGSLRLGVKKNAHIINDWGVFDNFRLTYLGEATAEEAFTELMGSFQNLIIDFNDLGAEAI